MKYCQVCQGELDATGACPHCVAKGQPEVGKRFAIKAVRPGRRPLSVLIVIDVDGTGSTAPFSASVPKACEMLGRGLAPVIAEIFYDVSTHGDLEFGEQPAQLCQHVELEPALDAIRGIVYRGGGDLPETHCDQCENLLAVTQWGADPVSSRNVLLMFATDDTKPLRSGKSVRQLGAEFRAKRVVPFLVCQETPSLREFVDAASGFLIAISTEPDDAEIQKVVAQLTATITSTVTRAATIALPRNESQSTLVS